MHRTSQFCGKRCQRIGQLKGGPVDRTKRATFLKAYGVMNPAQAASVKETIAATCKERYGHNHPMQSSVVTDKVRATLIKRYGVDNPLKSPEILARAQATNLIRYGSVSPLGSTAIRRRSAETCMNRFGASSNLLKPSFRGELQRTMRERYGVDHVFQLASVRSARSSPGAVKKRFETLRRNGRNRTSAAEDAFFTVLCGLFQADDVERSVYVAGFNIDFRVTSLNIFIQFDGVYWHGLDRDIVEIERSALSVGRDAVILRKFWRDRRCDEIFKAENLRLIRVTDVEFGGWDDKLVCLRNVLSNFGYKVNG